jgi:uncharacterized protein (TIGR00645 family)
MSNLKQYIGRFIFMSRWLQAPLYVGLIAVLAAYMYRFIFELVHLIINMNSYTDTVIMLSALNLIDVVMIANLLIMVVMGGYETFVSSLHLESHPDQPEWLDHMDAGAMKIKLAIALIGISSIHILRTFIEPDHYTNSSIMWQVIIHITLLISALTIAYTNQLLSKKNHG